MSKEKTYVFIGLQVVAWIIFVALCIEAGALLVNFVFSLFKPEIVKNLYEKMDLSDMYLRSKWAYFTMYTFLLCISFMKAFLFYLVIKMLMKLDLSKPFNSFVARQINLMSFFTLAIGLFGYIARQTAKDLMQKGYNVDSLEKFWGDSQAFILMAAVIYVIACIFAKGVELQNENDLTV
ncbi:MAG: DUF2975 domain-containing protein [Bacteroidetes bacterium]|nr:DUF2975 domain-containing protein [Bacteroidota bacterium]